MSMFTRFGQIFWGLLLVILDLRFNGFDVLPDFIGYILVAIGCGGIVGLSRRFSTAQTLSWILVVLSLVGIVIPNDLASLYGFLHLAVDCAMIWYLLGGVMEFASARGRPDLSLRSSICRVAYVVLMCAATIVGVATHGSRDAATLILVIFVVCIIPLLILILHLIHRVKHELATDLPDILIGDMNRYTSGGKNTQTESSSFLRSPLRMRHLKTIGYLVAVVLICLVSFQAGKRKEKCLATNREQYAEKHTRKLLAQEALKTVKLAWRLHISQEQFSEYLGELEPLDRSKYPRADKHTHLYIHPGSEHSFFLRFTEEGLMGYSYGGEDGHWGDYAIK